MTVLSWSDIKPEYWLRCLFCGELFKPDDFPDHHEICSDPNIIEGEWQDSSDACMSIQKGGDV